MNLFPDNSTKLPSLPKVPGNSGCRVELIVNESPAVRKTALTPEYAPRLHRQRLKQQNFLAPIPGIVVPKILEYDEVSFTMDHLFMLDAIEFLERASPAVIRARLQILFDLIHWELENSTPTEIPSQVFLDKLSSIQHSVSKGIWQRFYFRHAEAFTRIVPDVVTLPVGTCHGDLTFSNVMFSEEENCIGLTDFLDSFIDTPIVDLVKLRQDTKYHWTSLRYPHPHDRGKVHLINTWINGMICESFGDCIDTLQFWLVEIMNFLRIAPYVHQEEDHRFLTQVLAQIYSTQETSRCT